MDLVDVQAKGLGVVYEEYGIGRRMKKGYRYILAVSDGFSKLRLAFPLRSKKRNHQRFFLCHCLFLFLILHLCLVIAEELSFWLNYALFMLLGAPDYFQSDNGGTMLFLDLLFSFSF